MSSKNETEVFRMVPELGKCYATAKYTKRTGTWPKEKYYTSEPLVYLGEFIKTEYYGGSGDGSYNIDYFQINSEIKPLKYDYDGRTCLVEVPCNINTYGGGINKQKTSKTFKRNKTKSKKETINYRRNKTTKKKHLP